MFNEYNRLASLVYKPYQQKLYLQTNYICKKNIANLRYNEFVQLFGAPVYIYIYLVGN